MGTVHGTNFETVPELRWAVGHPFAILPMAVVCASPYVLFKKRDRSWTAGNGHWSSPPHRTSPRSRFGALASLSP
ncbi:hypothetical protein ACIQHY_31105 [Streptomyces sp. NPDC092359]|uniref:hypothetical protein n=1 Tax=Streptomyces sp. NPDC092359 TaxID=3366014 RepID=UPI00381F6D08